jgi:hypothetical protein
VLYGHYEAQVDRESAYEKLKGRAELSPASTTPASVAEGEKTASGGWMESIGDMLGGSSRRQGVAEAAIKSAARTIGSQLGREIIRGVLGSILGGKR